MKISTHQSIDKAHEDMKPGRMYINSGTLTESSINRSPSAYLNNPEEERKKYEYNTDNIMTLLKFVSEDGTDLGNV